MQATVEYVVTFAAASDTWIGSLKNTSAVIAAVFSVLIALTSLFYTRHQVKTHENHNRLMVTPHLAGWISMDHDENRLRLSLKNNGLGPAIVKDIKLFIDETPLPSDLKAYNLIESATNIILDGVSSTRSYEMFSINEFIPSGKEFIILDCHSPYHDPEEINKKIMSRAHLIIKYESILGDCYTYSSRID